MSRNHIVSCLRALAILFALGLGASAQDLRDMQLFAPADVSTYDCEPGYSRPNEGYFFNFDWLGWSIPAPTTSQIGFPNLTREVFASTSNHWIDHNSHDTSMFSGEYKHGQRVEVGRVGPDRWGWFLSTYRFDTMNQRETASDVHIVFQDVASGSPAKPALFGWVADYFSGTAPAVYGHFAEHNLPVTFDDLQLRNEVKTYNVELNALRRLRPFHRGGNLELFAGVRYMQFDNTFDVTAHGESRWTYLDGAPPPDGTGTIYNGVGSLLADSDWHTQVANHIVGPQLGGRWFKKNNRWTLSAEGRFFAGANQQRIRQHGLLGSELDNGTGSSSWAAPGLDGIGPPYVPENLHPTGFEHRESVVEWSPGVELRLQMSYEITKAVSLRVGWTGFWIDGIAWASRLNNYTIEEDNVMGINMDANRNAIFTQGLNVGIEINR